MVGLRKALSHPTHTPRASMSRRLVAALALPAALVVAAGFVPVAAQPPAVEKVVLDAEAARIAAIQKVSPAVVAVCISGGQAVGSGVVIDPEGYALTNFHVVQPTGPVMQCGLADGVLYDAVLVGLDRVGDVALVKLLPKEAGKPFPFAKLGDSDAVRVGDWSLAMGNPFSIALDFTPTVTYGLVSGTNRYQPPGGGGFLEYTDCIQVDTSINPGNSGGPLFNMAGELVGINGRISLEKRGRVNVGVGYAISINQIKNFLGHFYAGIDTDHATLGAAVGSADEDSDITKIVVKQVLDDSDAYRRGVRDGDQLITFAGRPMTSTNQYKNILGVFPREWRVPLNYLRAGDRKEVLVRLQGLQAAEKEPAPTGGGPPMPPRPVPKGPAPAPKSDSPAAKLYKQQAGYANRYFNDLQRDKLLAAAKKHGDFAAVAGPWAAEGGYEVGERKGDLRFEIAEGAADEAKVSLKLNVEHKLFPLKQTDLREQAEPIGSGGLMMALYHYHRLLTAGPAGFEGEFAHAGSEPFYPYPADGSAPKSLAALRVDCDVIRSKHGPVVCKWYYAKADHQLLGFETTIDKDVDPCEVYLSDYKAADGRMLPHRFAVRYGDKRYAALTVAKWTLKGL